MAPTAEIDSKRTVETGVGCVNLADLLGDFCLEFPEDVKATECFCAPCDVMRGTHYGAPAPSAVRCGQRAGRGRSRAYFSNADCCPDTVCGVVCMAVCSHGAKERNCRDLAASLCRGYRKFPGMVVQALNAS